MANEVYANGMEIACKAGAGKVIAAFPDVCMTPPENPATPPGVPVPYPNTAMASDTTDGSKKVKISDKEIMLKNKSCFKTSTGDEAGSAAKKGLISSKNKGKVYFIKWSMDVKVEGKNVDRHLDMTTNNHGSPTANEAVPWVYVDAADISDADCKELVQEKNDCMEKHVKENITDAAKERHMTTKAKSAAEAKRSTFGDEAVAWDALLKDKGSVNQAGVQRSFCEDDNCKDTLDCALVPFDGFCCPAPKKDAAPPQTPHHVIPAHCFLPPGARADGTKGEPYPGAESYDDTKAPCVCVDGGNKSDSTEDGDLKQHGMIHAIVDVAEDLHMISSTELTPGGKPKMKTNKQTGKKENVIKKTAGDWSFEEANEAGSDAVTQVKQSCVKECMKAQCEAAHKQMGVDVGPGKSDKLMLRADSGGNRTPEGFVPGGATGTGIGF